MVKSIVAKSIKPLNTRWAPCSIHGRCKLTAPTGAICFICGGVGMGLRIGGLWLGGQLGVSLADDVLPFCQPGQVGR